MAEKTAKPSEDLLARLVRAFFAYGYKNLSMTALAEACSLSRRALYIYFSSKDDVFRATTAFTNRSSIDAGFAAAEQIRASGGSALDIVSEIMNVRYGELRRSVNRSPHAPELTAESFRLSLDIMIAFAAEFQEKLAAYILSLQADRLLALKDDRPASDVADLLIAGARGVNQTLPPVPPELLAGRYRAMCEAVLFGCATIPPRPR
jgi:AcrR family transcriptional regulator